MTLQKGNVLWVDLGQPPKEVVGHEQGKKRPCVVLADFPRLDLVLVASMSTNSNLGSWPTCIKVAAGEGGLKQDCYIMLHQMRTISYDRIDGQAGSLSATIMAKVDAVLLNLHDL